MSSFKIIGILLISVKVGECIYGGVEAHPGEFPSLVSIQGSLSINGKIQYRNICGGTLITSNLVVTAAHCIDNFAFYPVDSIRIVAGAHKLSREEVSQQVSYFNRNDIKVHQNYTNSNWTLSYDIAVIRVDPPFAQTEYVKFAQLPRIDGPSSGICKIAGWGAHEHGESSDVLLRADVRIVSKNDCQTIYPQAFLNETQICAGDDGADNCYGDNGGGIFCSNLGYKFFAGVVSYGKFCGNPDYPGVYTEVSKFVQWIFSPF